MGTAEHYKSLVSTRSETSEDDAKYQALVKFHERLAK